MIHALSFIYNVHLNLLVIPIRCTTNDDLKMLLSAVNKKIANAVPEMRNQYAPNVLPLFMNRNEYGYRMPDRLLARVQNARASCISSCHLTAHKVHTFSSTSTVIAGSSNAAIHAIYPIIHILKIRSSFSRWTNL